MRTRTTRIETATVGLSRLVRVLFRAVSDVAHLVLFAVLVGVGLVFVGALVLVDLADTWLVHGGRRA